MLAALLALTVPTASAADSVREAGNFGLGLGGGSFVSGLSMKYFMDDDLAFEATLGSLAFHGFGLSGALLFEMPNLAEEDDFDIAWSVGPGASFWTYSYAPAYAYGYSYNAFAITAVLGLEMNLNDVPLDLVLEWRPGFYIETESDGYAGNNYPYFGGFGGHIRYYF